MFPVVLTLALVDSALASGPLDVIVALKTPA